MGKIETRSWIPVKPFYSPVDLDGFDYQEKLGDAGKYPFTRGPVATIPRNAPGGGSRQAGFGTPEATNKWMKFLLKQGASSLNAPLDLPTQIGYDCDHPMALGEVGKAGVSVCSLADIETLFDGIALEKMAVGSVVSGIGPIYMSWMIALNEKKGVPFKDMHLWIQNDCLKEFICRGTQIFPIRQQVKFNNHAVEFCIRNNLKYAQPISICGGHFRQAGATAVQEMAFTMADAIAFYEELLTRGLNAEQIGPYANHLFIGAGMDFFEEIAHIRALRRMWTKVLKERYGVVIPPMIGSRVQGRDYTAQQPLNNLIRGAIITLATEIAGCPGSEVTAYDEALALPTEESATLALRTNQIVAHESGVRNTIDPLAGSYYMEWLTDELERRAMELFQKIEDMGGAIPAIEQGFQQMELGRSAYEKQRQVEKGERTLIGVNKYVINEPLKIAIRKVDPKEELRQVQKLKKLKRERDNAKVKAGLKKLREAAREDINLMPVLIDVVKTYATVGEMCNTLRGVFGEYRAAGL
ncbi:MAG: methylmalonyl-CoA mutase family protein [Chloroflexota bacterium]